MSDNDFSDYEMSDYGSDESSDISGLSDLDDSSESSDASPTKGKSMLALSSESEDSDLEDTSDLDDSDIEIKSKKLQKKIKRRSELETLMQVKPLETGDLFKRLDAIKDDEIQNLIVIFNKSLKNTLDLESNKKFYFLTLFELYIKAMSIPKKIRRLQDNLTLAKQILKNMQDRQKTITDSNLLKELEKNIKRQFNVIKNYENSINHYNKYLENLSNKKWVDDKMITAIKDYIDNKNEFNFEKLLTYLNKINKELKGEDEVQVESKLKELRKRFKGRQYKLRQKATEKDEPLQEDDPRIIYLKRYILYGEIDDELRQKVYDVWNKFILNKSRYLELNKTFKKNKRFIGKKVSDEEIDFFDTISQLYDKSSKIVDTVNNYLKYQQKQELVKGLNKEITYNDINTIIKKFKADVRDKEELTDKERDLLNLVEISFKRSVSDNPKVNEFSILNFYIRALKYLLIDNRISLQQMIKLNQIEENFGKMLLSIKSDDDESLSNVKSILKYIIDNNENQLKIINILNGLKKGVSDDNVVSILVINNYIKAIIATGLKDVNKVQTYINEGKIDTEYGKYLLDIIRGNIKKSVPELYDEIISNFSNKKTTKFIRDPLNSNLVRRKLRIINDDDTIIDKETIKIPQYLKKCMTMHKLREWNLRKYNQDYIYFIGHPRFLTKEEMKEALPRDRSSIKYYGNELGQIDIGEIVKGDLILSIYEPTLEFWKLHCGFNHSENDKVKCNYDKLIMTLTDANGIREFYHGLYNAKNGKFVIFNEDDFKEECDYYTEVNKSDEGKLFDFYNYIINERQQEKIRSTIVELLEKLLLSDDNLDVSRKSIRERAEDLESSIYRSISDDKRTIFSYLNKVANVSILFDKTKVVYNLADYPRYLLYVINSKEFPYIVDMSYEQKLPILRFINSVDRGNIITLLNLIKEEIITVLAKMLYSFKYDKILKVNTKSTVEDNKLLDKILNNNNYKSLEQNLKELCDEKSTTNKVYLLSKDNQVYCATPSNYSKYLAMDNITDDDKELIEELFGDTSRLYKERKLLYVYLAKQYLANDKQREQIQQDIHDKETLDLELFGEILEDDYDVIKDVYKHIEENQKTKLTEKERIEIFNYVRSTIKDYSDITQDIITLLTDKKDEYIQKYVKDYKNRIEKYSNEYDEKSQIFKSIVENDIAGRIEIFKDILLVLAEKYRNKYVELENVDFASPFIAYLVQFMSEILDYIIKKENEDFEYKTEDKKETCYKCGKQSVPYTTTFLHEPSELIDDANKDIELMNKKAYICSQDCLAKLQETILEERSLKDDLIRSCVTTISQIPNNKDIVIKAAKMLDIPEYENFSIEELWDIAKLHISWVPDFRNKRILHCLRELCKLFRVKYDENKLIITWRNLVDNKKFYNEFISRIDVKKYENILKSINTVYRQKMKMNENYFSVDCNILEKDLDDFLSTYGIKLYDKFINKEELQEQDIIEFFNDFQDKFKCAVRESVMNKYKQYTRTVKLIYNYLLAVNRTIGSGFELNLANIKNKMKEIQKGNKSIDTDLNYMIESINNITKRNYTFDQLTKEVVQKYKTISSLDEKTKVNNLLRYIIPPTLIQLDFDEIMNVYEIYKKVGVRLMKYIRSKFAYNKDAKLKKEMESLLTKLEAEKPDKTVKKIIRPGMKREDIEKIKEVREQEKGEGEKIKRKIKLLQPKKDTTVESTEASVIGQVVEEVKTSELVSEEDQIYINFEKFIARMQTFIDNYIRFKLEIKIKKDELPKISVGKKRLYFEKDVEEGEIEEEEEEEEGKEVETKLEPTSIKFSEVVTDVNKMTEEPKEEEEEKTIFIEEKPQLVFGKEEEQKDEFLETLAEELVQDIGQEEIDII